MKLLIEGMIKNSRKSFEIRQIAEYKEMIFLVSPQLMTMTSHP
jgi:hypothetical protein